MNPILRQGIVQIDGYECRDGQWRKSNPSKLGIGWEEISESDVPKDVIDRAVAFTEWWESIPPGARPYHKPNYEIAFMAGWAAAEAVE